MPGCGVPSAERRPWPSWPRSYQRRPGPLATAGPRTGSQFSLPKVPSVPTGTAYVINSGGGTVTPIDLATNTPGQPIRVGEWADDFTIVMDGKTAYVVDYRSGTVTPIDLATNTPGRPVKVLHPRLDGPNWTERIAIMPCLAWQCRPSNEQMPGPAPSRPAPTGLQCQAAANRTIR